MHASLDDLESESIYILREAYNGVHPLAMLWSMGKDSTALLWLVRKAFFGRVPFPLVLLDTGMELPEVYEFRDRLMQEWALPVINEACPPESEMDPSLPPATRAAMRKTAGLKNLLQREKYRGIIVGIRRDEQGLRAKERVFSPRTLDGAWDYKDQPAELWGQYQTEVPDGCHLRIHPLLNWSEQDIWRYTQRENIPCVPLYFSKNGQRYRSLGEKNITFPVSSNAANIDDIISELAVTRISERAGRTMDSEAEDSFEILRTRGYM
jgi:sulfate adenylyltransferase subunit 2